MTGGVSSQGPRIDAFGERALLVRDADQERILDLTGGLLPALDAGRLVDVVPGDGSLLVRFDGTDHGEDVAREAIATALKVPPDRPDPRELVIAVRYGGANGPDLDDVAALAGMSADAVVAAHVGAVHTVRFLGFAPGFAYLGGLPALLEVPRLPTPRTMTPSGSVAIAVTYSAIYPAPLPGGWRIIGRTDRLMFDPTADPPTTLRPGDRVRFEAC